MGKSIGCWKECYWDIDSDYPRVKSMVDQYGSLMANSMESWLEGCWENSLDEKKEMADRLA